MEPLVAALNKTIASSIVLISEFKMEIHEMKDVTIMLDTAVRLKFFLQKEAEQ